MRSRSDRNTGRTAEIIDIFKHRPDLGLEAFNRLTGLEWQSLPEPLSISRRTNANQQESAASGNAGEGARAANPKVRMSPDNAFALTQKAFQEGLNQAE